MDVHATPILPDADEEFIRFREESRFWIQKVYLRFYIMDYVYYNEG